MPVEEFSLRALQDCFRKRRGTGTEVIGSLAHIQSHSGLVVVTQTYQPTPDPVWERACSRKRWVSQLMCR
ncbi:hypothetical protein C4J93_1683 [Pseudomonas sp. R2-37-08W]|nr:hypothetical protein C4J93_1683 [Pseudomonas sp. R2-37-08W]AZF41722.1 hypothetical protein C4J87_1549 [Pseudomonas sp. R1-43-08]AZF46951.1 hypothetical protein C4J86_1702 [Pseudomonas sp. R2-7-07]AZF57500.1 hypothetical protein C4J84_1609 [Pseudomonas sp. R11-23-07]